jgi:hypothetical protein
MKNKFNPILAYIPLFGYYYAIKHVDQLHENKYHFIGSSLVNAYTTIFAFGLINSLIQTLIQLW